MSNLNNSKPLIVCGRETFTDHFITVNNPFDGKVNYTVCTAGDHEIVMALNGARQSCLPMKKMPLFQRAGILRSAADYLEKNRSVVIASIVEDAGKPLRYAIAEFDRCIENLVNCSETAKQIHGEMLPMDASPVGVNRKGYWIREPVGIVLAISPFNFPLNLAAHKVAPAIAAGCPVILKPASKTPAAALWLTKALLAGGLPETAISCLCGSGTDVAAPLVQSPDIAMVTFTGSYETGVRIASCAGIKKLTFELGSNSAAIVDNELIDFDYTVRRLCFGAFYYQGQVCISVQRIYVHKDIFSRFIDAFVANTEKLICGDPALETTDIGPMISAAEAQRIQSWIEMSLENGARMLYGGRRNGSFISPTVLTDVNPADPLAAQEAFGPVVIIESVDNMSEALNRVNSSRFGLQAGIFTRRIDVAERAISDLQVGGIIVNDIPSYRLDQMPYGGVKDSGIGREGARYAIEEMTNLKMVVINNDFPNP